MEPIAENLGKAQESCNGSFQLFGIGRRAGLSMILVVLFLPPFASAQQSSNKPQAAYDPIAARSENGATVARDSVAADPSYKIGPDDMVDITVWKEPDLTETVPVRPDGKISLPLLNDVQAAGQTPTQLAARITEGLKKYVTDPQVTVIVTAIKSQRVFILGEVTRAGAYALVPGMTVLQALSSAGGFTAFANTKNIHILREENGRQVRYPFNYKEVVNGKKTAQNVVLKAGDTIVVP